MCFRVFLLQVLPRDLRRKSSGTEKQKKRARACVCAFFFVPLRPNWRLQILCKRIFAYKHLNNNNITRYETFQRVQTTELG